MFPPTIMTAPTSAIARPNPAMTAVNSDCRASFTTSSTVSRFLAPREIADSITDRSTALAADDGQADDDGRDEDKLRDHHSRGRE